MCKKNVVKNCRDIMASSFQKWSLNTLIIVNLIFDFVETM